MRCERYIDAAIAIDISAEEKAAFFKNLFSNGFETLKHIKRCRPLTTSIPQPSQFSTKFCNYLKVAFVL